MAVKKRRKKSKKRAKRKIILISAMIIVLFTIIVLKFEGDLIKEEVFYPIKYEKYVEKYSNEYDVDKYLVYAIMKQESNFRSDAVSPADARGLMQITQDTFNWLTPKLKSGNYKYEDIFNPAVNIRYGVLFISVLEERYSDQRTVCAAYNAGMNITRRWLGDSNYSSDGISLKNIPYEETAKYVDIVERNYEKYVEIYKVN
ncbi:MAG: lytic transglycosylase domain-containing protein [Proteocatella sp.]